MVGSASTGFVPNRQVPIRVELKAFFQFVNSFFMNFSQILFKV
ncbi:hypothetical protein HOU04_gp096 [Synechococcus phage S-T4]|uniref:Uncharacterized protein n=1 Tax=Synechococcus phage S-T4 TaxID=2268578 RepID=A0A385EGW2_9CAUD|nr:hypothetical protein HOU04_gp096 [Synechococcus phage S-T4]AXQ70495.1 hypothetical protein [Synechococcus phage S-T4]